MILHFSQIFFTELRTFMACSNTKKSSLSSRLASIHTPETPSLIAVGDASAGKVIGRHLQFHFISGENTDEVHSHLSRDVREYHVTVLQLDPEHGVRQWLDYRALDL